MVTLTVRMVMATGMSIKTCAPVETPVRDISRSYSFSAAFFKP